MYRSKKQLAFTILIAFACAALACDLFSEEGNLKSSSIRVKISPENTAMSVMIKSEWLEKIQKKWGSALVTISVNIGEKNEITYLSATIYDHDVTAGKSGDFKDLQGAECRELRTVSMSGKNLTIGKLISAINATVD